MGIIAFYCPQGCCEGKYITGYRGFRCIGQESCKNTGKENNFHSKQASLKQRQERGSQRL